MMNAVSFDQLCRFLPAHRLDTLTNPDVIREAIQHLNSLYKALASFVPLYIEQEIERAPDYRALSLGTFLFADVSGFTALSERLQTTNSSDGAEVLTLVMNDYFAAMLEILAKSDGQLLKFAGDALLAFFPAAPGDGGDASKAIRTGLRMQRAIKRFQPISDPRLLDLLGRRHAFELQMSIGIARGRLFEALVGSVVQRDHITQGTLPGRAMQAEAVGVRDDVIIDQALADLIGGTFTLRPLEQGFYQIVDDLGDRLSDYEFEMLRRRRPKTAALFDHAPETLYEALQQAFDRVEMVAPYVAPAVLHELVLSGDYHLRSENRFATTLFIHATGFADLLDKWGEEQLDLVASLTERYYNLVQRAITTRGGTLTRTDPYQLGVKLLGTFGVPVAHVDDADRAVDAALEINQLLEGFNADLRGELPPTLQHDALITQRIGITQGRIFAGEVGWKARREYTVMGDEVNLAARLMGHAQPGEILINRQVYDRVKRSFKATKQAPVHVKGKAKPIQSYAVTGARTALVELPESSRLPFTGQDALVASLNALFQQTADARQAGRAALVGDVGAGKTRIAWETVKQARQANFRVAMRLCSRRADRKSTWKALVAQLLDIDLSVSREQVQHTLLERLTEYHLLDLHVAMEDLLLDDQMLGSLDTQQAFINLIVRFLNTFAAKTPALIVIDDLHREHSAALDMLPRILESVARAPVFVLLTYDPGFTPDLDVQTFIVRDLGEAATYEVAAAFLDVPSIGARLKAFLWDYSAGRPLFLEALLHMLVERGLVEKSADEAELASEVGVDALPDHLRELIMSAVDSHTPVEQTLLRAASALGRVFTLGARKVVSRMGDDASAVLQDLITARVIYVHEDGSYCFRYGVAQRALYGGLSRSERLKYHRLAVSYWREHPATEEQPTELAYHLVRCGLLPEAIEVVSAAAERAERVGDHTRALTLYRHALDIFPDEKSISPRLDRLIQRG